MDFAALAGGPDAGFGGYAAEKQVLTRAALGLRAAHPAVFAGGYAPLLPPEGEAGSGYQVLHSSRYEHLAGSRAAHHPCGGMHGNAPELALDELAFAGMKKKLGDGQDDIYWERLSADCSFGSSYLGNKLAPSLNST